VFVPCPSWALTTFAVLCSFVMRSFHCPSWGARLCCAHYVLCAALTTFSALVSLSVVGGGGGGEPPCAGAV
jgi:hypothetical protein